MPKNRFAHKPILGLIAVLLVSIALSTVARSTKRELAGGPPVAPVRTVTDVYFGVTVSDPYRYMEDLSNPEVIAWFKGQNDYTRAVLARISGRHALLERMKVLDEAASARVTDLRRLPNDRYFYQKRLAAEDVSKLHMRDGLSGAEHLLVDPTKFAAAGGPHYVISYYAPSFAGNYVAVGVSPAGSEDAVIRVVDTNTGREMGDVIDRAQFGSINWMPGGRSFVYNRLQKLTPSSAPTDRYLNSRVYLHVLGDIPDQDRLVFGSGVPTVKVEPSDIPFVAISPGTPYALGLVAHGVRNEVTMYEVPIEALSGSVVPWKPICDVDDNVTGFDVHGGDLYLLSHLNASRYKVLHTKLANPDVAQAGVIMPPSDAVVQNISAARDALYVQELDGGIGRVIRLAYSDRKPEQIPLPFDGSVGLAGTDQRIPGTLLELTTWTKARKIYVYNPASNRVTETQLQPVGKFDEPQDSSQWK